MRPWRRRPARDDRPDPRTWRASDVVGMTDAEAIAHLDALHDRMEDEEAAERGGAPLGPISRTKGDFPIINMIVGHTLPDGTYEEFDPPLQPPTWDAEKIWDYDGDGNLLPEDQRPSVLRAREKARESARESARAAEQTPPAAPDEPR